MPIVVAPAMAHRCRSDLVDIATVIQSHAMRVIHASAFLLFATFLMAAGELDRTTKSRGKVVSGVERLLYVKGKTGISSCNINQNHNLRKIHVTSTAEYKCISASVSLGKLCLTSFLKDELLCLDLNADSQAITPDGKTLYGPMRDSDRWWVLDAQDRRRPGDNQNRTRQELLRAYGSHSAWMESTPTPMEAL
jgi:hypothetical protein